MCSCFFCPQGLPSCTVSTVLLTTLGHEVIFFSPERVNKNLLRNSFPSFHRDLFLDIFTQPFHSYGFFYSSSCTSFQRSQILSKKAFSVQDEVRVSSILPGLPPQLETQGYRHKWCLERACSQMNAHDWLSHYLIILYLDHCRRNA